VLTAVNIKGLRPGGLSPKKKCYGLKLEPNGQITVRIVLYDGTVLVRFKPYFLNIPY